MLRGGSHLETGETAMHQSAHVLFVNDAGEVLLRLRDDKPGLPYPGQWDLLGGAVEAGETWVEAAIREVREEVGLGCPPLEYFGAYPADVHNNVFLAPLSVPVDALVLTEGQRLSYVGREQARALPLVPWVARLLEDYFSTRASPG
jgi:8-oxo-dGTP diphosphatase